MFTVTNDGAKIDDDALRAFFDPLSRGHHPQAHRDQDGGLGLGLYICRQIALAHHGSIQARSDENRTIFEVRLPSACRQSMIQSRAIALKHRRDATRIAAPLGQRHDLPVAIEIPPPIRTSGAPRAPRRVLVIRSVPPATAARGERLRYWKADTRGRLELAEQRRLLWTAIG